MWTLAATGTRSVKPQMHNQAAVRQCQRGFENKALDRTEIPGALRWFCLCWFWREPGLVGQVMLSSIRALPSHVTDMMQNAGCENPMAPVGCPETFVLHIQNRECGGLIPKQEADCQHLAGGIMFLHPLEKPSCSSILCLASACWDAGGLYYRRCPAQTSSESNSKASSFCFHLLFMRQRLRSGGEQHPGRTEEAPKNPPRACGHASKLHPGHGCSCGFYIFLMSPWHLSSQCSYQHGHRN